MLTFPLIDRLPPYVFSQVDKLKAEARANGEDIIDFGMGNPDQPPPAHVIEKLVEAAKRDDTHRYSQSSGIPRLRAAICHWYKTKYDVDLDPDLEAIVTIGSKEGLAHLALSMIGPGDSVLVPDPCYPIHFYGFIIVGANVIRVPLRNEEEFLASLEKRIRDAWPVPKLMVINFPANPSGQCIELDFFEKIVKLAKEYNVFIVQDIAYAELSYDGYVPPSILQVEGAKDIAVETYSLSKSYNMPGWRVGFVCGNREVIAALKRLKSYLDYGIFTPIQIAAIAALEGDQSCVKEISNRYRERRDILCQGLNEIGWPVDFPKATMFVWAPIPEPYKEMGSLEFSKLLLKEAKVAVSPGIGFGDNGEGYVRFGLIENKHRIRQALRGIKHMLNNKD